MILLFTSFRCFVTMLTTCIMTAEKLNIGFVNAAHPPGLLTKEEEKAVKETQEKHRALLTIPRRYSRGPTQQT